MDSGHNLGDASVRSAETLIAMRRMTDVLGGRAKAEAAMMAAEAAGLASEVVEIINSDRFDPSPELLRVLNKAKAERALERGGTPGMLQEVLRRIRQGHRVSLEGRRKSEGDAESGRADILDHTERLAIQLKVVASKWEHSVLEHAEIGVAQVSGLRGEFPPAGYRREVHIHAENPLNRLFMADRETLREALRGRIEHLAGLNPSDAPPGALLVRNGHPDAPHRLTTEDLEELEWGSSRSER